MEGKTQEAGWTIDIRKLFHLPHLRMPNSPIVRQNREIALLSLGMWPNLLRFAFSWSRIQDRESEIAIGYEKMSSSPRRLRA